MRLMRFVALLSCFALSLALVNLLALGYGDREGHSPLEGGITPESRPSAASEDLIEAIKRNSFDLDQRGTLYPQRSDTAWEMIVSQTPEESRAASAEQMQAPEDQDQDRLDSEAMVSIQDARLKNNSVADAVMPTAALPPPQSSGPDYRCQPLPPPNENRCGPWFVNIGVYKAATRQALIDLDRCHPEIVRPVPPEGARGWFWEPSMWGTRLQARDFERYLPLIGEVHPGDYKVTGEKSPDYFFLSPRQIERMHRLLPRTKVFAIIREPGERLFSHFMMKFRQETFARNRDLSIQSPDAVVMSDPAQAFESFLADNYRQASWAGPYKGVQHDASFLEKIIDAAERGRLSLSVDSPRLRDHALFSGWDYAQQLATWAAAYPMNMQLLVVLFEHLTDPEGFPGGVDRLVRFLELAPVPGIAECFEDQGDVKSHAPFVMSPLSRHFLSVIFQPSVDVLNAYLKKNTDLDVEFWYEKMYPPVVV